MEQTSTGNLKVTNKIVRDCFGTDYYCFYVTRTKGIGACYVLYCLVSKEVLLTLPPLRLGKQNKMCYTHIKLRCVLISEDTLMMMKH